MNLRVGRIGKPFAPSFGWCLRCETPWRFVKEHDTEFAPGRALFPLCEKCWRQLGTPQARMVFYRGLWMSWSPGYARWEDIEAAVLAESVSE